VRHDTIAALPGAIARRAGAVLLIAASASLGTYYAFTLGSHFGRVVAVAFAAMALGGELLKPVAVEQAFAAGWRQPARALACLAVAGVAILYSLTAELAFSAGARGDLAASRKAAGDAAAAALARRQRAEAELAGLKPTRAVGELEALHAKQPGRDCAALNGSFRVVCQRPGPYAAELARARRRAELEAVIAAAGEAAGGPSAVGEADPQAAAVSAYLTAAGWPVRAEQAATWLHLLPVLLLEIGSALGLLVARAPGGHASAGVPTTFSGTLAARRVPEKAANVPAIVTAGARHPVLTALAAAGRPLSVSELAAAMSVSAGEASKRWREVEAHLQVGWNGRWRAIGLRGQAVH